MILKPIVNLACLSSDPVHTAILSFVKPVPFLMGTHRMNMTIQGIRTACVVFELCDPEQDDKIHVEGNHNVTLVRDGYRWPMRLMPTAMRYQMMAYPESAKAGLARIKPVQRLLSAGYLGLDEVSPSQAAMRLRAGPTTLLDEEEARHWLDNFDLVSTCDFGSHEWRAIRPIQALQKLYKARFQESPAPST